MYLSSLYARWLKRIAHGADWQVVGLDRWKGGTLLLCWHGQLFIGAALLEWLGRTQESIAPIVMEYPWSRTMARFASELGVEVIPVPGYEQADARSAKLQTLVPPLRAGYSLFMAADGHRGPSRIVASDTVEFAMTYRVPLLPVALDAKPALSLPVWDRKMVPLPGARMVAVIGEVMEGEDLTVEAVSKRLQTLAQEAAKRLA